MQKISKKNPHKTSFLPISVFRPADRNFSQNISVDCDRNFGFGHTLLSQLNVLKVGIRQQYKVVFEATRFGLSIGTRQSLKKRKNVAIMTNAIQKYSMIWSKIGPILAFQPIKPTWN